MSPVSGGAFSERPFLLAIVVVTLCGLRLVFEGGVLVISACGLLLVGGLVLRWFGVYSG